MFSKNISNNELKFTPTFGTQLKIIIDKKDDYSNVTIKR